MEGLKILFPFLCDELNYSLLFYSKKNGATPLLSIGIGDRCILRHIPRAES